MVLPILAAINPRQRVAGTPFENVAEEVLNGIFCHYEPPVSEHAQYKAARDARKHPERFSFSQVKKNESILRTSKLYRKNQAMQEKRMLAQQRRAMAAAAAAEAEDSEIAEATEADDLESQPSPPRKKAVTWRDEQYKPKGGIEGAIEGCAVKHCDFLGFSTRGGDGLTETFSPSIARVPPRLAGYSTPQSIIKPSLKENSLNEEGGKTMYDDEGNPINDNSSSKLGGAPIPQPPSGLSQLRRLAKELGDDLDVYEPDDYDQPFHREPMRHSTPRDVSKRSLVDDQITMQRSQSPINVTPNHYDTLEQLDGLHQTSSKLSNRPSTPYRRRENEHEDIENGNQDRQQAGQASSLYDRRSFPISPSKRSEVYSEITMDEAIRGRTHNSRSVSPAKTSEGVEVGFAYKQPKSPGRDDPPPSELREVLKRHKSKTKTPVYDDMGNIVEQRSDLDGDIPVAKSYNTESKSRRHSVAVPTKAMEEASVKKSEPRRSTNGSRRISEPLPPRSDSKKKEQKPTIKSTSQPAIDTQSYDFNKLRRRSEKKIQKREKKSSSSKKRESTSSTSESGQRLDQPSVQPSSAEIEVDIDGGNTTSSTSDKRNPRARMSIEPPAGDDESQLQISGPLPPTPRQKKDGTASSKSSDKGKHSSTREERKREEELRERLRRTREDASGSKERWTKPPAVESSGAKASDWAYNAVVNPLSPQTVATDDEIRAEVSSVGWESPHAYRSMHFPNPLYRETDFNAEETLPVLEETQNLNTHVETIHNTAETDLREDSFDQEPHGHQLHATSTLSNSTQSEQENVEPIPKTKSYETGRKSRQSASSCSTRTKKLWKGWKKTIGKVKQIVHDIDEERIPAPFMAPSRVHPRLQQQHPTLRR